MLLYSVSDDYINYLLTIDRNVMFNKDRPYAGLLFELNEQKWYAPLTSFKEGNNYKPSYIWLYAVHDKDDGNKITAYIKFRSMIPVADCAIKLFDLDIKGQKYKDLLLKQHFSIKSDKDKVVKKAQTYFDLINKKRVGEEEQSKSCNFQKLAAACKSFKCP